MWTYSSLYRYWRSSAYEKLGDYGAAKRDVEHCQRDKSGDDDEEEEEEKVEGGRAMTAFVIHHGIGGSAAW